MSNIGPLTTTFTAPASCATATGLYQLWDSNTYHFEQGPLASMADCFPSGYDAAAPSQYYSPGICPSGYTTACSSTDVLSATVTETAYTCCPMGRVLYTCNGQGATGSLHLGCTTVFGDNIGIALLTAISGASTYSTTAIASSGDGIGAHSIAVRWRAGDTISNTLLATATSQAIATPTPTHSSSQSSGLSTAGRAGIGAGAGALVLAITGALCSFLWMRRRKQQAAAGKTPLLPQSPSPQPNRGPPPTRPPRPLEAPNLGPRAPLSPPPKSYDSNHTLVTPLSPTLGTSNHDVKKAREVEIYTVRNVEIRKKHHHQRAPRPPPLPPSSPRGRGGAGGDDYASGTKSPSVRDSISTFATLLNSGGGPFELPGAEFGILGGDDIKKQKHHYEMHELYGSDGLSSPKSFETFTSLELPGSFPLPPTSPRLPPPYEAPHRQQLVELEESSMSVSGVKSPQKTVEAPHRHRQALTSRWRRGTSWAPAELPTPDERGFL